MLRLVARKCLNSVWKSNHFVTSKRQVNPFLRVNRVRLDQTTLLARHFSEESSVRKDALQTEADEREGKEMFDLDGWKSIMRSQARFPEQQVSNEVTGSDEEEDMKETGGDSKESSSLEATRELVLMWRQAGKLVPQEMTEEEVQTLANLATKSARKKYLKFLAIKEGHKRSRKEKQQKRRAEKEASLMEQRGLDSTEEDWDDKGSKLKNTPFLQFWDRTQDKLLAWRSAQAMVFGQPLVFDMSYDSNMTKREIDNTVSQLLEVEGWNRRATEPFHLHFCNLQPDGPYKQELLKRYGAETWERLFVTDSDRQHVDLFPREQLVYLTADSPNVLRTFDHSKVYIIGALVDRSIQSGLSLANAKRLKLATARLPLDEYLHWDVGAKNLTLDQMIRIMLTIKDTGKWEEALQFVPKRKHDGFHQQLKRTESATDKTRGHAHHGGSTQDGDRLSRSGERIAERTFKSESLHKPSRESGFSGRDRVSMQASTREKAATTKVRTSFKNNIEARKNSGKQKMWWCDD
ncbi:tRNA methyltransferase 10 homolog C [Menidia menidia]